MLRSFNPKTVALRAERIEADIARSKAARRAALMAGVGRMARMGPADLTAAPKADMVRSEAYRRAVAMLCCKACGTPGYSQAAHPNTGKGMAAKTCDLLCFPLCCARPGIEGCHVLFDTGRLLGKAARRAIEPAWARDTQRQILTLGMWPKDLPIPEHTAWSSET